MVPGDDVPLRFDDDVLAGDVTCEHVRSCTAADDVATLADVELAAAEVVVHVLSAVVSWPEVSSKEARCAPEMRSCCHPSLVSESLSPSSSSMV